jgi:hypothetical protein
VVFFCFAFARRNWFLDLILIPPFVACPFMLDGSVATAAISQDVKPADEVGASKVRVVSRAYNAAKQHKGPRPLSQVVLHMW